MRVVLFFLLFPLASRASFDALLMHCPPASVEEKVKARAYEWKRLMEKTWCKGDERSVRYVIVIHCSKSEEELPHVTTFHWLVPGIVDRAKVNIDPETPEMLERALPHALMHAIIPGCLPKTVSLFDLPAWVQEGMSQMFVTGIEDDARKLWGGKLAAATPESLKKLLTEDSRTLSFYTQSGLFVRFLLAQGGVENFKGFLVDLGFQGTPSALSLAHLAQYERVFKKRYGKSLEEIEKAFQNYLGTILTASPP